MEQAINWEEYALCYDAIRILKPYQSMMQDVVRALALQPGECVLDAGCGTGNLALLLSECTSATIFALDAHTEMLKRAQRKCFGKNISFLQHTLDAQLPFMTNSFDRIACINVLYTLSDPLCVLQECRRVLMPGGKIVLVTPKQGYENGYILKQHCGSDLSDTAWANMHASPDRERELIKRSIEDAAHAQALMTVAQWNRRIARHTRMHFYTPEEIVALLERCGFSTIETVFTYAEQNILATAT